MPSRRRTTRPTSTRGTSPTSRTTTTTTTLPTTITTTTTMTTTPPRERPRPATRRERTSWRTWKGEFFSFDGESGGVFLMGERASTIRLSTSGVVCRQIGGNLTAAKSVLLGRLRCFSSLSSCASVISSAFSMCHNRQMDQNARAKAALSRVEGGDAFEFFSMPHRTSSTSRPIDVLFSLFSQPLSLSFSSSHHHFQSKSSHQSQRLSTHASPRRLRRRGPRRRRRG